MEDDFEWPEELVEMVRVGKKVQVFYCPGHRHNELRHIRAIVDEEYVVYRVWSRHRQGWLYRVEWLYEFYLKWENGRLAAAR